MSRIIHITKLARSVNQIKVERAQPLSSSYSTMLHSTVYRQNKEEPMEFAKNRNFNNSTSQSQIKDFGIVPQRQIGENVPRKDKINFLVSTLMDLQEAVYACVAWERAFPIGALKNELLALQKEQQWHRVIQVIKWMLSKGQGRTRGTYGQLIHALDMDRRGEEAHEIWKNKPAFDLHSAPWKFCDLTISVYYRNNMLEDLVKLFKGLEAFDRKSPEKSIVQKVADAYMSCWACLKRRNEYWRSTKDLFAESS